MSSLFIYIYYLLFYSILLLDNYIIEILLDIGHGRGQARWSDDLQDGWQELDANARRWKP